MNAVVTVGIDLAKNVFAVHGVDATRVVLRRIVTRAKLPELVARQLRCLIGMEACCGAMQFGDSVKLMSPVFVVPALSINSNGVRSSRMEHELHVGRCYRFCY